MLMNALKKQTAVTKSVSILMGHMSVPAAMDIAWVKIKFPAIVREKLSGKLNNNYIVSFLDVDECALNIHECEQICVDTTGSYECDCLSNYTLQSDGLSCVPSKGS